MQGENAGPPLGNRSWAFLHLPGPLIPHLHTAEAALVISRGGSHELSGPALLSWGHMGPKQPEEVETGPQSRRPHHPKDGRTEGEAGPTQAEGHCSGFPRMTFTFIKPGPLVTLGIPKRTLLFSILKAEMEEAPMATGLPERTYTQWMFTNHGLYQTWAQVKAT